MNKKVETRKFIYTIHIYLHNEAKFIPITTPSKFLINVRI